MSFSRKEDLRYQIKYDNNNEINYNGIDYSLNESQFVNLKSKEACASKIVDSKRDQLSASEDQGSVILNTPKDLKK